MGRSFSLKLAMNNIKNNRKFYLPYFLACVGIIAMFYIISFLAASGDVREMSQSLAAIMSVGVYVIGLFSVIFLFYINSFLMKRRKKEIGLYNILGMEKRHIGKILMIENLTVSFTSIVIGLGCGVLFSKLIHLFLSWVFGAEPPFGISVSGYAMAVTAALFGVLFLLNIAVSQMSIRLSKPIELLRGGEMGEKEPKTKWLLAVIGIVCLGAGYYIAITTESPLSAILLFFVAVILVIIGTYCLFTAGSVAILKAMKKNKKFYYKPANFTAVSGLIYRMKQNAVGLASICILSTMVLVMVSGTVSLFAGMNDVIEHMVPGDVAVTVTMNDDTEALDRDAVRQLAFDTADDMGISVTSMRDYQYLMFVTAQDGDVYQMTTGNFANVDQGNLFVIMTEEEYEKQTGQQLSLGKGETAVCSRGSGVPDDFTLGVTNFHVAERIPDFIALGGAEAYMLDIHYMVVPDEAVLEDLYQQQLRAFGDNASHIKYDFVIDLDEKGAASQDYSVALMDNVYNTDLGGYESLMPQSRYEISEMYHGMVGGLLFLGIFLGIVFTFAAALIIYYKQISEGYYDKDKFEIMQKVGMSKAEVKTTIRRQVLLVFFLPLVMAGIHILAAFKMITRLLLIFSMTNVPLFALCTAGTFLVFAVIYALVYAVTAREYYKIVG